MSKLPALLVVCSVSFSLRLFSQGPPPSDPPALTFAAQSIAAMTGTVNISDVILTGNVTWNGVDTGTATLQALGTGESRVDFTLSAGSRTEVRDVQTGTPIGKWVNQSGTSGPIAYQNCATDAAWFFRHLAH